MLVILAVLALLFYISVNFLVEYVVVVESLSLLFYALSHFTLHASSFFFLINALLSSVLHSFSCDSNFELLHHIMLLAYGNKHGIYVYVSIFQVPDSEPTISTTLKYTSRRLVGHEIDETWTHSLYECFEFCLNMPFLACSSINFGVKEISGTHKCEINRFKENHYPQDLMSNKEFVYYNVHW